MAERLVYVYADLDGKPHFVGKLWEHVRKGRASVSFEYDQSWLSNGSSFALEPLLALTPGTFHAGADKSLFGALGDSAPDRWGRMLMRRAVRRQAEIDNAVPRTLSELDYLLGVSDEARQGALRFKEAENGPFLAGSDAVPIPPIVELPRLLSATENLLASQESDEDLRLLLAPGSSLGGARPKASIRDRGGQLCIAKFPHKDDEITQMAWEAVALTLARQAGIDIAEWRVESVVGKKTLIIQRFDRHSDNRIPFLSAMSMIGARDNEDHSYLEIADALRRYGASPKQDLAALWRRIVFNVICSNTDDHLRNHGFLYEGSRGWRLSPAYDLNSVPVDIKPRILSTAIDLDDGTASLDLALSVATEFGVAPAEANEIIRQVGNAVSDWRHVAQSFAIGKSEIARMASAFDHEDLRKAVEL